MLAPYVLISHLLNNLIVSVVYLPGNVGNRRDTTSSRMSPNRRPK
jgi:hypothetical protein